MLIVSKEEGNAGLTTCFTGNSPPAPLFKKRG